MTGKPPVDDETGRVLDLVLDEVERADRRFGRDYASMHEAYGVLFEEVAEFFDEVRLKQSERDPAAIQKELLQVAAVAIRAARQVSARRMGGE
jgi:NTP pyrophosphatase (non-canonical NTP hydrolase)